MEGAEAALVGRFNDGKSERSRLAILAAGAVAFIDVTATSAAALDKHAGAMKEMLDSLSVGQPKARAAPPPVLATPGVAATAAPGRSRGCRSAGSRSAGSAAGGRSAAGLHARHVHQATCGG